MLTNAAFTNKKKKVPCNSNFIGDIIVIITYKQSLPIIWGGLKTKKQTKKKVASC